MHRSYSELMSFDTFEERLQYLLLDGKVAEETFGGLRALNQMFYRSNEWIDVRNYCIEREARNIPLLGGVYPCDLGCDDHPITSTAVSLVVHHMNPITAEDIINRNPDILNPEYLITTIKDTHDIISYGGKIYKPEFVVRRPNDTIPWKQ